MVIGFKPQFVEPILNNLKLHTIRDDKNDRWHEGMVMHMATGVRTKNYNNFKTTPCTGRQTILMEYIDKELKVFVDGKTLSTKKISILISLDGFLKEVDFIKWFFPDGKDMYLGKIIHWTNYRY